MSNHCICTICSKLTCRGETFAANLEFVLHFTFIWTLWPNVPDSGIPPKLLSLLTPNQVKERDDLVDFLGNHNQDRKLPHDVIK